MLLPSEGVPKGPAGCPGMEGRGGPCVCKMVGGWVRSPGEQKRPHGQGGPSPLTKVDSLGHLASGH